MKMDIIRRVMSAAVACDDNDVSDILTKSVRDIVAKTIHKQRFINSHTDRALIEHINANFQNELIKAVKYVKDVRGWKLIDSKHFVENNCNIKKG